MQQQLRIAWHTNDLARIVAFYRNVLDATVIAEFADHAGFDGAIMDVGGVGYHFEFTCNSARDSSDHHHPACSPNDLIALYIADDSVWEALRRRVLELNVPIVRSANPYWDDHGFTIADPDGRRIVFHNGAWS